MLLSPTTPKQSAKEFTRSVRRIYPANYHLNPVVRFLSRWPCGTKSDPSVCLSLLFSLPHINFKPYMPAVLLIRTYAFFNRNNYLLAALICALAGVVGYQLFVDTSEMMRMFLSSGGFNFTLTTLPVLPFVTPPFVSHCRSLREKSKTAI